jgi:cysteinyl-tRNA synthetase
VLDIGLSDNPSEGAKSLGVVAKADVPDDVLVLIDAREVARIGREWPEADALRDQITKKGYSVEDSEHGPKISKL